MPIIDLLPEEKTELCEHARKIIFSPSLYPGTFCNQSREVSSNIYLSNKNNTIISSYLLFRDFPTECDRKTPENIHNHIGETTIIARIQAILLSYLGGEIISYEAEGDGYLFQDIIPVKNMEKQQTSIGSNVELEIHTEQAFSKYRPDFLSLACLRSDPNAWTYILTIDVLLVHLSVEEIAFLKQPLWKIGVDLSFQLRGEAFIEGDIRGPIPILSLGPRSDSDQEEFFLCFDQDLMVGINEEAQEMISKIVRIYYEHRTAICLQPGDILILDNRKVVHGRSAFSPKYDGTDRFLVRCFATLDFQKSESVRKGRMVLAKYS